MAKIQGPEEPLPGGSCVRFLLALRGVRPRDGEQIWGMQTIQPHSDPRPRTCTHWTVGDQLPPPRRQETPSDGHREEGGGPQREDPFPT